MYVIESLFVIAAERIVKDNILFFVCAFRGFKMQTGLVPVLLLGHCACDLQCFLSWT